MKRKIVAFFILSLGVTDVYSQKNLVNNGGFEQELDGWSANADIKTSPFVHFEGKSAAVLLSFKGDQWIEMDQSIRLPKNSKAIKVSFATQSLNIQKGTKDWNKGVVILAFQSSGQKIGEDIPLANIEGSSSWQKTTKQLIVPSGANSVKLMVALSECTGTFYVDDFKLVVIPAESITGNDPKNPIVPIKSENMATSKEVEIKSRLADKNVINAVADLYGNLKINAQSHILFGQQDATKSGRIDASHFWSNEQQNIGVSRNQSDVKTLTGSYPAVYGFDFAKATDTVKNNAWYSYEKNIMRELAIDAYNRKGVVTFCWHVRNPVTDSSFYWEKSPVEAVAAILPGVKYNEKFNGLLKQIADYDKLLVDKNGQWIPIIFRPWHEMDGDWFWWGSGHCTPEQYKQLYQYTVTYLKDSLGVHNMLFAWSPDRKFDSEEAYMKFYPGDNYVDIVGFDEYEDLKPQYPIQTAINKVKIVSDFAQKHDKIAAMTEAGLQSITDSTWFTQRLLKSLTANNTKLAYVLIWANTSWEYWIPYKGHPAEKDFVDFTNDSNIQLGNKMPDLYQTIK